VICHTIARENKLSKLIKFQVPPWGNSKHQLGEIPSTKHQIPNNTQANKFYVSNLEIWNFEFVWDLVLGIWCFLKRCMLLLLIFFENVFCPKQGLQFALKRYLVIILY